MRSTGTWLTCTSSCVKLSSIWQGCSATILWMRTPRPVSTTRLSTSASSWYTGTLMVSCPGVPAGSIGTGHLLEVTTLERPRLLQTACTARTIDRLQQMGEKGGTDGLQERKKPAEKPAQ